METLTNFTFVALGGALGAMARYAINISPLHGVFGKFPLHTFVINIVGSFLIGFCMIFLADKFVSSEHIRLFIFVGVLGAFTTFSTFELEIWTLIQDGDYAMSLVYLCSSVIVGFLGLIGGVALAKQF